MPTADDYAAWIVKNKNKRGTPEFQTVVEAYNEARSEEESTEPADQPLGTALQRGASRVVPQIQETIQGLRQLPGALSEAYTPSNIAEGLKLLAEPETYEQIGEERKNILREPIRRYGSAARAKETIATDPLGAAMDVSLVGSGAGAGLQQIPKAAKYGKMLERGAQALDPLSVASRVVTKPFREVADINIDVPTNEQLSARKTQAYERARNAGVMFTPDSFEGFVKGLRNNLRDDEGNLTRIVPELHADSDAALKALESYVGGSKSLDELEDMRRIVSDAAGSPKPADRRIAMLMKERLDDFVDEPPQGAVVSGNAKEGAAALAEARDANTRLRKSQLVDDLIRNAELSAPNFSGSGMENALRTEFRRIAKNPKQMRLFTQAERAAIEDVAKGGPITNAMRMVGKFAPTGVVSGSLSTGAGAGLGFAAGGPIGSGVGAVMLPVVGAAARGGATALTSRAARRAGETMRAGKEGATAGQRLGYMLEKYGDKLTDANPQSAFLVDMARRATAAGKQIDPYYARQLAAQLARMEQAEQAQE